MNSNELQILKMTLQSYTDAVLRVGNVYQIRAQQITFNFFSLTIRVNRLNMKLDGKNIACV